MAPLAHKSFPSCSALFCISAIRSLAACLSPSRTASSNAASSFSRFLTKSHASSGKIVPLSRESGIIPDCRFANPSHLSCCFFISSRHQSANATPDTASILLTPAAMADSPTTRIAPILPVDRTCVPPHNSFENPPISTTRTVAPYLSPKNCRIVGSSFTSPYGLSPHFTATSALTFSFTCASTLANSSSLIAFRWEKSNRSRSGPTYDPFCLTPSPNTPRSAQCKR